MVDRSPGFFDLDDRLAELSAKGDDLERVKAFVEFASRTFGSRCSGLRSKPPCRAQIVQRAAGQPSITS